MARYETRDVGGSYGDHEGRIVDRDDQIVEQDRASSREPFSVGQVIALAIGIGLVATGALGLSRAGTNDLTTDAVSVAEMGMTGLLAVIHLMLGAVTIAGVAGRSIARSVLMVLGPTMIFAGAVALVSPSDALGYNDTNGIVYLVSGAVALVGAIATPAVVVTERIRGRHATTHAG